MNGPLVGALMVGLLAGCTGGSPTPPAPIGDVVTQEEAEALGDGLAAYEMQDGTKVVVGEDHPLPAPVEEDLADAMDDVLEGEDDGTTAAENVSDLAEEASAATGKKVLLVYLNPLLSIGDEEAHPVWVTHGQPEGTTIQGTDDYDAQIANVEEFIAAQPDPSEWAYVVQPR
ncbi:hypothetical protein [uncultured Cellulomonas sp.]|uniref:hypothetical protein n=1 Tax=uncultured Cellulomonas sp. TaxID=189682 RepID=UPI0028EAF5E0|nr:hypothetical protein [uncultured Cellulomonas sp.]